MSGGDTKFLVALGSEAQVPCLYGRLVIDGLWHLPDRGQLLDAKGNVRVKGSPVSGTRRPASRTRCWQRSNGSRS
jgi:hypothetical protein